MSLEFQTHLASCPDLNLDSRVFVNNEGELFIRNPVIVSVEPNIHRANPEDHLPSIDWIKWYRDYNGCQLAMAKAAGQRRMLHLDRQSFTKV